MSESAPPQEARPTTIQRQGRAAGRARPPCAGRRRRARIGAQLTKLLRILDGGCDKGSRAVSGDGGDDRVAGAARALLLPAVWPETLESLVAVEALLQTARDVEKQTKMTRKIDGAACRDDVACSSSSVYRRPDLGLQAMHPSLRWMAGSKGGTLMRFMGS